MPSMPQQIRAAETSDGIRLGLVTVNEERCMAELAELRRAIESWAKEKVLWHDSAFLTPFIHKGDAPERYDALLLTFEGPLYNVFNFYRQDSEEHYEHFRSILKRRGFDFEMEDHVTICIMPSDEKRADEYLALYRWQWIQNLATRRLYDIHEEVFEHFAKHPDHLVRLEWRQYEEFLDAVFRNQGFLTELGPGTNDGGLTSDFTRVNPSLRWLHWSKPNDTQLGRLALKQWLRYLASRYSKELIRVSWRRHQDFNQ